ncbi:uncharacterized protein ANIA_11401 [Aspergillus nidulans FGSC A4]|uniref:Uncharacterized protein n=1 Tax=Emericella nidulans (strain FGSC A4 / ATCC 38163 / CBS 112.46 / NRRL 194 / M139) TaxID=227321 RepID=C8V4S3_EMENI|nr:hypothetical protein [Aspergillus nidulans FGSC A4]CBF75942.1 TPA: hypothetical protein ANIA_11401 [Aspergillus nidulans FGSC A4]
MGLGVLLQLLLIIDPNNYTAKASVATHTQALDHQNPDTYTKYQ